MQRRRHPSEVGRVTHRSIQGDKEPLKLSKVVALIIANIFDVDIASLSLDRIDVRGFIGIAAIGHGAVEARAGDTGEGDKALVPFGVSAGGEEGAGGGVEPATQEAADRVDAAHLPAHGEIE